MRTKELCLVLPHPTAVAMVLWMLVCLGCRNEFELGPVDERGAAPHANAGTGTTLRANNQITLDGSRSLDPDGTIAGYRWEVVTIPPGSLSLIVDDRAAVTTFTPDLSGPFAFQLEVTDGDGNVDRSRVDYYVTPDYVTVDAGSDVTIEWRNGAQLAGTYATEPAAAATLAWTFISKPSRSVAVLQNPASLTPGFVADAEGTYVVELTVSTALQTRTDTVTVTATAARTPFDGNVIDAAFSGAYLIVTSDSPPRLRFIATATGTEISIPLPSTPTAMSMDIYENNVAVATAGQVSIVSVFTKTLTNTFNVPFSASHLVFGPFQLVHCFTPQAGPIQTLDVATGTVTPSNGPPVSGGTVAKQAPNDNVLYSLDRAAATPDLSLYSDGSAPISFERDSPYSGEYPLGDDLWLGYGFIAVGSGAVFEASPYLPTDMIYLGRLGGDEPAALRSALWNGPRLATLHELLGSPTSPGSQLRIYDNPSRALLESVPLPDLVVNGIPQRSVGRVVGYSSSFPNKIVFVASAGSANAIFVTAP